MFQNKKQGWLSIKKVLKMDKRVGMQMKGSHADCILSYLIGIQHPKLGALF